MTQIHPTWDFIRHHEHLILLRLDPQGLGIAQHLVVQLERYLQYDLQKIIEVLDQEYLTALVFH